MGKKDKIQRMLQYVAILLFLLVFLFPILWVVLNSLKTNAQTIDIPPLWIFQPNWSNYSDLFFGRFAVSQAILNSIIVSTGATFLAIALGFPAAYSISRYGTGGERLAFWILSLRMAPPIVFVVPMFLLFLRLNLLDSQFGLMLLYQLFNIPLAVWVLKSFIDDLPRDFEEAAEVDGCTPVGAMARVVLPLTRPGIVAVAILCFFFSFNEFTFAYVFTMQKAVTMPAMAAIFVQQYSIMWANLSAALILMVIPMIIFAMLVQRELVRGLTMGAVKG